MKVVVEYDVKMNEKANKRLFVAEAEILLLKEDEIVVRTKFEEWKFKIEKDESERLYKILKNANVEQIVVKDAKFFSQFRYK